MIDLDSRLERLAAEAARDAVPPPLERVSRRGRRRRQRQLAGTTLLVAAAVAAGLVLPARLAGRSGPTAGDPPTAATDVRGAGYLGGPWFGKTDVTVYLDRDADPAERRAVRERLQALDVVDQVWFETGRQAYKRQLYRAKPDLLARTGPASLPDSFRVRLRAPDEFKQLFLALCQPGKTATGKPSCMDGVDSVVEDAATIKPLLVGRRWFGVADAVIVLPKGTSDARRRAIQARLEAIDGVRAVTYQSPAETYRQLPEKVRKDSLLAAKLNAETLPPSLLVTLDEPRRVEEFHQALCGSRRTGDCPDGLVVVVVSH